jgi:hypothetical protein
MNNDECQKNLFTIYIGRFTFHTLMFDHTGLVQNSK